MAATLVNSFRRRWAVDGAMIHHTHDDLKACVGLHVSVCICVYKCMRVHLCVTHTHTNVGLKVGVLIGIHA